MLPPFATADQVGYRTTNQTGPSTPVTAFLANETEGEDGIPGRPSRPKAIGRKRPWEAATEGQYPFAGE